jgi:hypothetical protein
MNRVPLLNHPLSEPTAFTPEALLAAVRAERGLPVEPPPPVCVLDFDGDLTDWLVEKGRARAWKSWPCFHTTLFSLGVEGAVCGIIPRTIGGPYAVLVAEQLAAAGAQVILGLTSAGRVLGNLPIPSLVIATSAVRDEGTSFHYLPPGERIDAPAGVPTANGAPTGTEPYTRSLCPRAQGSLIAGTPPDPTQAFGKPLGNQGQEAVKESTRPGCNFDLRGLDR